MTSVLSLLGLTYALIEGHDRGWTSTGILAAFGVAALAATTFVVVEGRVAQPMVDVSLFRRREFTGGIVALFEPVENLSATNGAENRPPAAASQIVTETSSPMPMRSCVDGR